MTCSLFSDRTGRVELPASVLNSSSIVCDVPDTLQMNPYSVALHIDGVLYGGLSFSTRGISNPYLHRLFSHERIDVGSTILRTAPATVVRPEPRSLNITVWGYGFVPRLQRCVFASSTLPARRFVVPSVFLNSTTVLCELSELWPADVYRVHITNDLVDLFAAPDQVNVTGAVFVLDCSDLTVLISLVHADTWLPTLDAFVPDSLSRLDPGVIAVSGSTLALLRHCGIEFVNS